MLCKSRYLQDLRQELCRNENKLCSQAGPIPPLRTASKALGVDYTFAVAAAIGQTQLNLQSKLVRWEGRGWVGRGERVDRPRGEFAE